MSSPAPRMRPPTSDLAAGATAAAARFAYHEMSAITDAYLPGAVLGAWSTTGSAQRTVSGLMDLLASPAAQVTTNYFREFTASLPGRGVFVVVLPRDPVDDLTRLPYEAAVRGLGGAPHVSLVIGSYGKMLEWVSVILTELGRCISVHRTPFMLMGENALVRFQYAIAMGAGVPHATAIGHTEDAAKVFVPAFFDLFTPAVKTGIRALIEDYCRIVGAAVAAGVPMEDDAMSAADVSPSRKRAADGSPAPEPVKKSPCRREPVAVVEDASESEEADVLMAPRRTASVAAGSGDEDDVPIRVPPRRPVARPVADSDDEAVVEVTVAPKRRPASAASAASDDEDMNQLQARFNEENYETPARAGGGGGGGGGSGASSRSKSAQLAAVCFEKIREVAATAGRYLIITDTHIATADGTNRMKVPVFLAKVVAVAGEGCADISAVAQILAEVGFVPASVLRSFPAPRRGTAAPAVAKKAVPPVAAAAAAPPAPVPTAAPLSVAAPVDAYSDFPLAPRAGGTGGKKAPPASLGAVTIPLGVTGLVLHFVAKDVSDFFLTPPGAASWSLVELVLKQLERVVLFIADWRAAAAAAGTVAAPIGGPTSGIDAATYGTYLAVMEAAGLSVPPTLRPKRKRSDESAWQLPAAFPEELREIVVASVPPTVAGVLAALETVPALQPLLQELRRMSLVKLADETYLFSTPLPLMATLQKVLTGWPVAPPRGVVASAENVEVAADNERRVLMNESFAGAVRALVAERTPFGNPAFDGLLAYFHGALLAATTGKRRGGGGGPCAAAGGGGGGADAGGRTIPGMLSGNVEVHLAAFSAALQNEEALRRTLKSLLKMKNGGDPYAAGTGAASPARIAWLLMYAAYDDAMTVVAFFRAWSHSDLVDFARRVSKCRVSEADAKLVPLVLIRKWIAFAGGDKANSAVAAVGRWIAASLMRQMLGVMKIGPKTYTGSIGTKDVIAWTAPDMPGPLMAALDPQSRPLPHGSAPIVNAASLKVRQLVGDAKNFSTSVFKFPLLLIAAGALPILSVMDKKHAIYGAAEDVAAAEYAAASIRVVPVPPICRVDPWSKDSAPSKKSSGGGGGGGGRSTKATQQMIARPAAAQSRLECDESDGEGDGGDTSDSEAEAEEEDEEDEEEEGEGDEDDEESQNEDSDVEMVPKPPAKRVTIVEESRPTPVRAGGSAVKAAKSGHHGGSVPALHARAVLAEDGGDAAKTKRHRTATAVAAKITEMLSDVE